MTVSSDLKTMTQAPVHVVVGTRGNTQSYKWETDNAVALNVFLFPKQV